MRQNKQAFESGNVFLIILVAVALFAALAFTISRGFRSATTSSLSDREGRLWATEVMAHANTIQRAVDRLRRNGCSEKEISFYTDAWTITSSIKNNYNNTSAPHDFSCHVFHPNGGNVAFRERVPDFERITSAPSSNIAYAYHYVTRGQVVGLGKSNANDPSMRILSVNESACRAFNKYVMDTETIYKARMGNQLNVYNGASWNGEGIHDSFAKPGLGSSDSDAELRGQRAACIEDPSNAGQYSIYVVFFER